MKSGTGKAEHRQCGRRDIVEIAASRTPGWMPGPWMATMPSLQCVAGRFGSGRSSSFFKRDAPLGLGLVAVGGEREDVGHAALGGVEVRTGRRSRRRRGRAALRSGSRASRQSLDHSLG